MISILYVIAAVSIAIAAPLRRTPISRDGTSTTSVIPISNATVEAFHGHALLAQAAYCDNAAAALPNVNMILVGGDGGTTPRC